MMKLVFPHQSSQFTDQGNWHLLASHSTLNKPCAVSKLRQRLVEIANLAVEIAQRATWRRLSVAPLGGYFHSGPPFASYPIT